MIILGVETSCDETSCAIVKDGRQVLANVITSQIKLHRKTGGVVPEVAAREHVVNIIPALETALKKAKIKLHNIDAVAVTYGPGLLSSLIIGVNSAMALAYALKKPLIPVNHIEGHMYANYLNQAQTPETPVFPAAVLTASGGHNELILWKNHGEYKFLGATLDDAAGEAFDKVARLLGLPYPGGPQIQKAAMKGDPNRYPLPRAWVTGFDFSFSGLKTAVLRLLEKNSFQATKDIRRRERLPVEGRGSCIRAPIPSDRRRMAFVADVAASFQESVCEVLATKLVNAAKKYHVKEVHLAGGVSANAHLRQWVQKLLAQQFPKASLRFCTDLSLCTDNAAMIAAAGYYQFKKNPRRYKTQEPITADPNLPVKNWK